MYYSSSFLILNNIRKTPRKAFGLRTTTTFMVTSFVKLTARTQKQHHSGSNRHAQQHHRKPRQQQRQCQTRKKRSRQKISATRQPRIPAHGYSPFRNIVLLHLIQQRAKG